MPRSELIKFRLSTHAKRRIERHAERSSRSVAAFMRDLTAEVVMGRSRSDAVRADMASVRQLANAVLACADEGPDASHAERLAEAARRLRDLANRHLGTAT